MTENQEEVVFPWQRFWSPRGREPDLSDGGFLIDPGSDLGKYQNGDLVQISALAEQACLVLLGEPGIGKSHAIDELEREYRQAGDQSDQPGVERINLAAFGDEGRLVDRIATASERARSGRDSGRLFLLLDGLDECPLPNVAAVLEECLADLPRDDLYVRITCRSFEWPATLERALRKLRGSDAVSVYGLAPLRRSDVAEACAQYGLDAEAFLTEVSAREVVALTIKPISLRFLLDAFRADGGKLPTSQVLLYQEGCRRLCVENNDRRKAAKVVGKLDVEERILVAGRIAAITLFCRRSSIARDRDAVGSPTEMLRFDVLYGMETVRNRRVHVDSAAVAEVLSTGLFTSQGSDSMQWAHQSYADFLAARYLTEHAVSTKKMLSLLTCDADPGGKVIPQLQEVAAWLASMDQGVRHELLQREPELLLRSDITAADPKDRAALVDALLELEAEGYSRSYDRSLILRYGKVAHSSLADQLRPYILRDSSAPSSVRGLAIDFARVCNLRELQEELLDLVLDHAQPVRVREDATRAVRDVADDHVIERLRPVALTQFGEDPEDSIKGNALYALWPKHISADELFTSLTPPKRPNLLGSYRWFLINDLVPRLPVIAIPRALTWLLGQLMADQLSYDHDRMITALLETAYEHLYEPGVLDLLVQVLLAGVTDPAGRHVFVQTNIPVGDLLGGDTSKRRAIVLRLISSLGRGTGYFLLDLMRHLLKNEDILWLLGEARSARDAQTCAVRAEVVRAFFDRSSVEHIDAIVESSVQNETLVGVFAQFIQPVDLASPEAASMREQYRELDELNQRRHESNPPLDPPPAQRIVARLDAFESGTLAAWWLLNMELTLEPNSLVYGNEGEPDLTKLYGWQHADEETMLRIVNVAAEYIVRASPQNEEWLGNPTTFHRPACAGFRALYLLQTHSPSSLEALPPEVWRKWAAIILAYPYATDDMERQRRLVTLCYRHAPQEIVDTAVALIGRECAASPHPLHFLELLAQCWDDRLGSQLLAYAQGAGLAAECMGDLLRHLLVHTVPGAAEWAESLVRQWRQDAPARAYALAAGKALLTHAGNLGWAAVWELLQSDREAGRELTLAVAHWFQMGQATVNLFYSLSEKQVVELFLWLSEEFPRGEDPIPNGFVGERYMVGQWRDAAVQALTQRGTPTAVAELQRLAIARTDLPWLKWRVVESGAQMRAQTWIPVSPEAVLKLATNPDSRLVSSGEQLLDVLIESLRRLQRELQMQETPAIVDLWNEMPGKLAKGETKKYRPKDENSLSDYVKRFLDRDLKQTGIIANREVEIRRPQGAGQGQRTDIHVDAIAQDQPDSPYRTITVVIEVKGCWHDERDTAMQTQLVDRYLLENHLEYGIYLVGRYYCDVWDHQDSRKEKAVKVPLGQAQQQFDDQATRLSHGHVHVRALVLNTALP